MSCRWVEVTHDGSTKNHGKTAMPPPSFLHEGMNLKFEAQGNPLLVRKNTIYHKGENKMDMAKRMPVRDCSIPSSRQPPVKTTESRKLFCRFAMHFWIIAVICISNQCQLPSDSRSSLRYAGFFTPHYYFWTLVFDNYLPFVAENTDYWLVIGPRTAS